MGVLSNEGGVFVLRGKGRELRGFILDGGLISPHAC